MDPVTIVTALNAALSLSTSLIPLVQQAAKDGVITVEQQKLLADAIAKLQLAASSGKFTGPQWEPSR